MAKIGMLPGWGFRPQVLQPLARALSGRHSVSLLSAGQELEAETESIWLLGWSLGGMQAARLAVSLQQRCAGLILLASNASFVQRTDWSPAMGQAEFSGFVQSFHADAQASLRRFIQLCSHGAADSKALRQQLAGYLLSDQQQMNAGLQQLQELDIRCSLQEFGGPKLAVFARQDALLPLAAAARLAAFDQGLQLAEIEGCHAMVLEQVPLLAKLIDGFIQQ